MKKGHTSLFYQWGNKQLLVYTIDKVKLLYWSRLGIAEEFTESGNASFCGYNRKGVYHRLLVPVYRTVVPILPKPKPERMSKIKRSVRKANNYKKIHGDPVHMWAMISTLNYMSKASQFALDYNPDNLFFDAKASEFLIWDRRIIPIDPFVPSEVLVAIHLKRYRTVSA